MLASTTVNASPSPERSEIACGRVVAALPDVARRRPLELGQDGGAVERVRPERLGVRLVDRRLEGGGEHVRVEDPGVRVVDDRGLDPTGEERVRLAREELVERVLARDEHGEPAPASPGAPPLLPQRRDRAGEADGDRAVEQADVDAELERVRRRDARAARPRPAGARCRGAARACSRRGRARAAARSRGRPARP